jgi:hypothetical protein
MLTYGIGSNILPQVVNDDLRIFTARDKYIIIDPLNYAYSFLMRARIVDGNLGRHIYDLYFSIQSSI